MKYSIHQIDFRKDKERVRFEDYDRTIRFAGKIDPSIYKEVYRGETKRADPENMNKFLEELFIAFNISSARPKGYSGVSVSVSDVIVVDGQPYFVDSVGFRPLEGFEVVPESVGAV